MYDKSESKDKREGKCVHDLYTTIIIDTKWSICISFHRFAAWTDIASYNRDTLLTLQLQAPSWKWYYFKIAVIGERIYHTRSLHIRSEWDKEKKWQTSETSTKTARESKKQKKKQKHSNKHDTRFRLSAFKRSPMWMFSQRQTQTTPLRFKFRIVMFFHSPQICSYHFSFPSGCHRTVRTIRIGFLHLSIIAIFTFIQIAVGNSSISVATRNAKWAWCEM